MDLFNDLGILSGLRGVLESYSKIFDFLNGFAFRGINPHFPLHVTNVINLHHLSIHYSLDLKWYSLSSLTP